MKPLWNKYIFISCLLGATYVESAMLQPPTTPEFEEAIVIDAGKKTAVPLSEALPQLLQGISDQTFGKDFIDKIVQAEAKQLTGEYVDHWPNGRLKIKANFKAGKVDGHVHGWYDDAEEAFKAFFYENIKAGIHLAFYPESPNCDAIRVARVLRYNFDGQLDDEQQTFGYTGRLKSLITYRHGLLNGKVLLYNLERKCTKDQFFKDGKLVPGKTSVKKK